MDRIRKGENGIMVQLGSKKHLVLYLLSHYFELSRDILYKMLNARTQMDRDNLSKEINILLRNGLIREIHPSVYMLSMKGLVELKQLDSKKLHRQMLEIIQEVKKEGFIK
jgi:hypothetical protein